MGLHVLLLSTGAHCVDGCGHSDPYTNLRSVFRSFDFAKRNNKTFFRRSWLISGREDLNLRPRGPKPRALPS